MRCPNCGNRLIEPSRFEYPRRHALNLRWGGTTCDHCPAVIEIELSNGFWALSLVTSVLLLPSLLILVTYGLSALALIAAVLEPALAVVFIALSYLRRKGQVIKMRPSCSACGTLLDSPGTRFCAECGAPIQKGLQATKTTQAESKSSHRARRCMVCNLSLDTKSPWAQCPHCGGTTHEVHLLEWVHVHGNCPLCKKHLDEREISKTSYH